MFNKITDHKKIAEEIDRLSAVKNSMTEFFLKVDFYELKKYTKDTNNKDHLDFIARFPNYAILTIVAENPHTAPKTLRYLFRSCHDVPPILSIIEDHPNFQKSKKTATKNAAWREIQEKIDLHNNRIIRTSKDLHCTYGNPYINEVNDRWYNRPVPPGKYEAPNICTNYNKDNELYNLWTEYEKKEAEIKEKLEAKSQKEINSWNKHCAKLLSARVK
jgi:hypothetical protein